MNRNIRVCYRAMDLQEAAALICRLEQDAGAFALEATYRPALERVIAELMDSIYAATGATKKRS